MLFLLSPFHLPHQESTIKHTLTRFSSSIFLPLIVLSFSSRLNKFLTFSLSGSLKEKIEVSFILIKTDSCKKSTSFSSIAFLKHPVGHYKSVIFIFGYEQVRNLGRLLLKELAIFGFVIEGLSVLLVCSGNLNARTVGLSILLDMLNLESPVNIRLFVKLLD